MKYFSQHQAIDKIEYQQKGIAKGDATKSKHTHTLAESKWVNLVKKVGPVLLTRFPRNAEAGSKTQNISLFICQKVSVTIKVQLACSSQKFPYDDPPFSNVDIPFIEETLITIVHAVLPIC